MPLSQYIRRFTCGLIALLALTGQICAQGTLRSVDFQGNRMFSARTLLDFSGLKVGQGFQPEMAWPATDRVLHELAEEGYYFARIDSLIQLWPEDST